MELYDVFISYRRSDGMKTAEALYKYLTTKGLRVFWDIEKMEYGKAFPMQLEQAIVRAPTYVLVVTEDVFRFRQETETEKDYVRHEIRTALKAAEGRKEERPLCILDPVDGYFPNKDQLPGDVRDIADVHRIPLEENQEVAFQKVLALATRVTCSNLWNAAHRWFYGSKESDGRFARLNICEGILPNVDRQHRQTDIPIYTSIASRKGDPEDTLPLLDALGRTEGHLYLIGEGGIGKTTALMHIMSGAYEHSVYTPGTVIPLFVELSFAPDTPGPLYDTQVASFIRRSVYRQLRTDLQFLQDPTRGTDMEDAFTLPDEVAVAPITKLFSRRTAQPEILLLLDGLNEVSTVELKNGRTVMDMIIGEIDYLMRRCPNVRIVLTSRSGDTDIGSSNPTRLYLSGIKTDAISEYLQLQGFSEERIAQALSDPDLAKTLQVPLFLSMYAALSQESSATTQGEILRLFFHERSRNLELYTNQDRLSSLEENAGGAARALQEKRITARMYRFMLDFILPELACYMEKKGLFHLSAADAQRQIQALLTDTGPGSILGSTGKAVFTDYRRSASHRANVAKTAADLRLALRDRDSENWELITDGILICCETTLGILQKTNGRWSFVHQHIRDYFAAVRHIHALRIAVHLLEQEAPEAAADCLAPLLRDVPVGITVRKFIGEYLLEHKNKPLVHGAAHLYGVPAEPCERNLIDRALGIYRGRFEGRDGYSLYSLLKILTQVRGSLAGCDLSRLDLTGCDLNGAGLGIYGLAASLNGAKLGGKELFFTGHTEAVRHLHYSSNGKQMLSASNDGKLIVWDTLSGIQKNSIVTGAVIFFARFTPFENRILVAFRAAEEDVLNPKYQAGPVIIQLRDSSTGEVLRSYTSPFTQRPRFTLSPDGRCLLCNDFYGTHLQVLSTEDLQVLHHQTHFEFSSAILDEMNAEAHTPIDFRCIHFASFWGTKDLLLVFQSVVSQGEPSFAALLLPINDSRPVRALPPLKDRDIIAAASCQGKICLVAKESKNIRLIVMDLIIGTVVHQWQLPFRFSGIQYSHSGDLLFVNTESSVLVFETRHYHLIQTLRPGNPLAQIRSVADCPRLQAIALGTSECTIHIYDSQEWTLRHTVHGFSSDIAQAAFSPDGAFLATATTSGLLQLWDASRQRILADAHFPGRYFNALAFSPDIRYLCVSRDASTRIFRLPDLSVVFAEDGVAKFSPDHQHLLVDRLDHGILYPLWDLTAPIPIQHQNIKSVFGNRIITLDTEPLDRKKHRTVSQILLRESYCTVSDIYSGAVLARLGFEGEQIHLVSVCSRFIAIGTKQGRVRIFSTEDYSLITEYDLMLSEEEPLSFLDFDAEGYYLSETYGTSLWCKQINIRETERFSILSHKENHSGAIGISPGGTMLIDSSIGPWTITVALYHSTTNELLHSFELGRYTDFSFVMDANDSCIALHTSANTLTIHSLGNGQTEWSISAEPGLEVLGVDLRNLHPDSSFTAEQWEILRTYGAIIE